MPLPSLGTDAAAAAVDGACAVCCGAAVHLWMLVVVWRCEGLSTVTLFHISNYPILCGNSCLVQPA
jgi:hypothetical protein